MRVKRLLLTIGVAFFLSGILIAGVFLWNYGKDISSASDATVEDAIAETLAIRRAYLEEEPDAELPDESVINVLLLGLDARKEDDHPHCDAIHMFSLDLENWTMRITSVPRGTYVYIPTDKLNWEAFDPAHFPPPPPPEATEPFLEGEEAPADATAAEPTQQPLAAEPAEAPIPWDPKGAYISNQSYVSNSCALVGMDYGIEQIERISGIKSDYVVTVGFSQTLGILRQLGLPTVESLQFLRHRQGYKIGDPQRSHNQALFMKDLITTHGQTVLESVSLPMERVLFGFVDTNMSFGTAHALLHGFLDAGIQDRPDDITLTMRPYYETTDYHFDPENPTAHIEAFLQNVAPHLNPKDFSGASTEEIQTQLISYLVERLASEESVADLINKRIWLQIEDDDARELMQYDITAKYVLSLEQFTRKQEFLTDYILEKETLGKEEWAERGKTLLRSLEENTAVVETTHY